MKWAKERDQFIAQTMAFVQSIAGKKPEIETRAESHEFSPVEFAPIELARADQIEIAEPRIEIVPTARPRSIPRSDVREEVEGRVAAFRAHQQIFHRERDAYYNSVLARVRVSAASPAPKAPAG